MRHRGPWACAALLAGTLATRAADLDVAQLGIRLPELPEGATPVEVMQRDGGSELTTHFYTALLSIWRDDAPVAPGSDVASPAYRALLDRRFPGTVDARTSGAPTSLGGHSGWTVVEARPADPTGTQVGLTHYLCVTYTIVGQHLYRLSVSAEGDHRRPPEFDGLVRLLSRVRFSGSPPPERRDPGGSS